ncbi:MAG: universal stress protein [Aurantimonas endophytica]|uniref:universal stress protein n=1 Tax=Aurantimonas endophytica TaxID=1522175 RepID=UPI003001EEB6
MKTIMAATDLSHRSALGLLRAAALAKATDAQLRVVHAIDNDLPAPVLERRVAEAEERLAAETAGLALPELRREVVVGDVFWALHRAATAAHADLIVTGDHRRSRLRDIFQDTTVERLIRVSAVPVLIARTDVAEAHRHAVVGVESAEGPELLEVLARLGRAAPARATILHAVATPGTGLMYYAGVAVETIEEHRHAAAVNARSRLAAGLTDSAIPLSIEIVDAAPAAAIAAFAAQREGDLIVVSSHARRGLVRGMIGSVSGELIRHGLTDLLIVPRLG